MFAINKFHDPRKSGMSYDWAADMLKGLGLMEEQPMPTGPRRPLPVDEELAKRTAWLIRLRWFAGAAVLALTGLATALPGVYVPWIWLLATGVLVIAYNIVFLLVLNWLEKKTNAPAHYFSRLASAQFITDWVILTVLVHLTGGMGSPILFFFVFHAILASILLPPRPAFLHALAGVLFVGLLAAFECMEIVPHRFVVGFISVPANNPIAVGGMYIFFISAIFMAMYLTGSITARLWRRTKDLIDAVDSAETAHKKTRTINEIARTVSSTLEIQTVLDGIVAAVVKVMAVDAASLRLIDPDQGKWLMRASFGLPDTFLEIHDNVSPYEGAFIVPVIEGRALVVSDLSGHHGCKFPEAARSAGLKSLMAVPMRSGTSTIGVLRLFSKTVRDFSQDDVDFITALANQVTASVENARAYRRLEGLESAKSRFFFMAAHELKSPVAAVQSSMDLLREGYLGDLPDNQLKLVERSYRRLGSLRSLLADLMDMGSLQGGSEGTAKDVDIGAAVSRIVDVLKDDATAKNIDFRVDIGETGFLSMNEDHLDRLVSNLVGNAIKYTPSGGKVTVSTALDAGTLALKVEDTGVGISSDAISHVFEEFYRAEGVKKSHEGTGLGLALVKRIADRYQIKMSVESVVGQGTKFTAVFPKTIT